MQLFKIKEINISVFATLFKSHLKINKMWNKLE